MQSSGLAVEFAIMATDKYGSGVLYRFWYDCLAKEFSPTIYSCHQVAPFQPMCCGCTLLFKLLEIILKFGPTGPQTFFKL